VKNGFWQNGYLLAQAVYAPDEVDAIREHFMAWNARVDREDFDRVDPSGRDPLAQYPRIIHPHRTDRLSMGFLLDQRLRDIMVSFLDEEPVGAQTMFYFKPPGGRGQALHQDQHYLRAGPGTCIAAWLAVDDCDEENGCLQVVPGSHELPLLCHIPADTTQSFTSQTIPVPEGYAPEPALMKAGDVLFFHGSLIHGSGPNRTPDRFRRSLIAHYLTGDARAAARFYHPLIRFDGSIVEMEVTAEGSECGIVTDEGIQMVATSMPGPSAPH